MSLLVEGFPVSSVAPGTPASFYDHCCPLWNLFHICDVSPAANYDVVLGHDWASLLRDHLISLGHRLSSNFDPWQLFLTGPATTPTASSGGLNGTTLASAAPALAVS
ncbi:hypothetical protein B0H13DRAFT_2358049 [Mycena leptocephala]|nr:hypothetical protein B0H13DRAFT_2358049 [Mycena leptocephala]